MNRHKFRIGFNSPVILGFTAISLIALLLGYIPGLNTTRLLFCVYRSSLANPLTWVRMFTHVLGHSGFAHFFGNMLLFLLVGPTVEKHYGSGRTLLAIAVTAGVTGLVHFFLFPNTGLLGASGIVFLLIVLSAFTVMEDEKIPLTLLLVIVMYLGKEIYEGVSSQDNISQLTHIIGGACGILFGLLYLRRRREGSIRS